MKQQSSVNVIKGECVCWLLLGLAMLLCPRPHAWAACNATSKPRWGTSAQVGELFPLLQCQDPAAVGTSSGDGRDPVNPWGRFAISVLPSHSEMVPLATPGWLLQALFPYLLLRGDLPETELSRDNRSHPSVVPGMLLLTWVQGSSLPCMG